MKIFLDTEFSCLRVAEARLISIALVAEDGREFYAELPHETWQDSASTFVLETVVPQLQAGDCSMTPSELSLRLRTWLKQFEQVEIVTDSPDRDFPFLQQAVGVGWPVNVAASALCFDPEGATLHDGQDLAAREAFDAFWVNDKNVRHHALADARALRSAWVAYRDSPAEI